MSEALPSFDELQAALHETTARLARELALPGATAPGWSALQWDVARAVAAMQGISVVLAHRLRWRGPARWQGFLEEQERQALGRHARIGTLIGRIDAALLAAGIPCVALKGAALRPLGLYADGERVMGDIDLLVERGATPRVGQLIGALGFTQTFTSHRETVFEPLQSATGATLGEHVDSPLKIEVHENIAEALPLTPQDITHALWPASPLPGINPYPSNAALFAHLALHAAGNMRAHALRLLQILDLARLAARLEAGDWEELQPAASARERWWMYPPLSLCARLFPGTIPAAVLARARHACPRRLQRAADRWSLTEISWSNLRIAALPGLAWSRSARETLRFAASRVLPARSARARLAFATRTQPQLGAVPWYGIPHHRRILRWLTTRPPRVQTMSSLRAALRAD